MTEQSVCQHDRGWNFNNWPENERAILKQLCQRIEKLFELPACRLYRHFASEADDWHRHFSNNYGRYYRGVHVPSSEFGYLPPELRKHLSPIQRRNKTGNEPPEFDNVVYIRDSTCTDRAGCAITYAHELQHIVQHARFPKLMKVNSVLRQNLGPWDPTATQADIPVERDAIITSKCVAETIFGPSRVREFADKQIKSMELAYKTGEAKARNQKVKWEFFLNPRHCDLKAETLLLAQKHKKELGDLGIDVDEPGFLDD